jgi:hypothetical protein
MTEVDSPPVLNVRIDAGDAVSGYPIPARVDTIGQ